MAIGVGRKVEPDEILSLPVEQLTRGHRIVEEHRLVGVIQERILQPFGGCRSNVHVKVDVSFGTAQPVIKTWCYTGGTRANVIDY